MRCRILAIFLAFLCAGPAFAQRPAREMVVMVTLEGVSLDQLAELNIPAFHSLVKSGAIGLMNNKTGGGQTLENNAVTIGAGTRGLGYEYAKYGFNARGRVNGEIGKRVFVRNMGIEVPDTAVVQTKLAAIRVLNSSQRYNIVPGLLGQLLQDAGVDVAVFGNSDQGEVPSRSSVTIAMNSQGWVADGDVGERTLIRDPRRPFGVRTNYDYLLESVKGQHEGRIFVVLEAGDSGRVEASRTELSPARYRHFKRLAVVECTRFVAALNDYLKTHADRYLLAVVVAAQESAAYENGDRLTPILLTGTGIAPGLLSSSGTKWAGLIANLDLAPTILQFFELEKDPRMIGTAVVTSPRPEPLRALTAMNDQIVATFTARRPVLVGYVYLVVLGVILAILSFAFHGRPAMSAARISKPECLKLLLIALMLVPVSLLAAPAIGIYHAIPSAAFVAASALAAAYVLNRWMKDSRLVFAVTGVATAAALSADLLFGAPLMKKSILGYDPIGGSRFYGIGNEYTGVLIGGTLLGLYSLFDYISRFRWKQLLLAGLVCAAVALLIGLPNYGTNFGGTAAALFGFGFALIKAREGTSLRRTLAVAGACVIVVFMLMLAANLTLEPAKQSHIGRAFAQAQEGGPHVLLDIAIRKWSVNLHLMRYSIWTHAFISLIIGFAVLFYRPMDIVRRTLRKHPLMNAGFMGILVSTIVAMLTNDSGVVMAATALLYLTVPLMFMAKVEADALSAARERPLPAAQTARQ